MRNSIGKDHLTMSDDAFNALKSLKKFNYEHIYSKANSEEMVDFYKEVFNTVFSKYLEDVKNDNKESHIFKIYLNDMSEEYTENTSDERKVIDYIAGMTDDFIVKEYNSIVD